MYVFCSAQSFVPLIQFGSRDSTSNDKHHIRPRTFPNSYWTTPLLVACEYPWTPTRAERSQKLDMLLRAGVLTFIDLTESGELSPYAQRLAAHASRIGSIELGDVEYHSFPIPDRCLPRSESYVRQILDFLGENTRRGRCIAVVVLAPRASSLAAGLLSRAQSRMVFTCKSWYT